MTIDELVKLVSEFNAQRGWHRKSSEFVIALMTEVGELAEWYKWKGADYTLNLEQKKHISEELADVIIYLVCMAIADEIDLTDAIVNKIDSSGVKYPLTRE